MINSSSSKSIHFFSSAHEVRLLLLEKKFLEQQATIEAWFNQAWEKTPPPWMASVDLRNAGFKLAPVDTNLFPAGFNNLDETGLALCVQAMQATFAEKFPGCQRVLLIPENHTRNFFYLESVSRLLKIIRQSGVEVRLGSYLPDLKVPLATTLPSGETLILEPIIRKGNRVGLEGFDPCLILLNHDLSEGIPESLKACEQRIEPPLEMGWATRLKSQHFYYYSLVADSFAKMLDIDPWLINPLFHQCGEVNFIERKGEECLSEKVSMLLDEIKQRYAQYQITETPFVMIKADAGTYGMGIMSVTDPAQVLNLNRKERMRMSVAKGKQAITKVLIQEGVHTFEVWGPAKSSAEPVVYMIGRHVVGGFYRIHKDRGNQENLNAPGMHFEPVAFEAPCNHPDPSLPPNACQNRLYAYSVIARLALLAASKETKEAYHDH